MIVSATVTSVYSVGLIAIDRFLYILYGLQYQRWIYPNRARLLILITWVIGMRKLYSTWLTAQMPEQEAGIPHKEGVRAVGRSL